MPETEWKPTTATELANLAAENFHGERRSLMPVGGRTALNFGYPVVGEPIPVSLAGLNRLLDFPARDMTVTVEAGMRIEELQEQLAVEKQRLPIDLPEPHRATIGGAVACDASGPSRFGYGTLRDYVIGISAVDGQGRLFSAGGRVVKNVAGYDLCKLLTGSLGVLGIITQVTLRLRPLAGRRGFHWLQVADERQLEPLLAAVNLSDTRPVIVDLLNPKGAWQIRNESKRDLPADSHILCLGYEGSAAEVDWQMRKVMMELEGVARMSSVSLFDESADALWDALTDFQTASDDPVSFRVGVLPSETAAFLLSATADNVAVQAHAGLGVIIGHLPDSCTDVQTAKRLIDSLRARAARRRGTLTVTQCDPDWSHEIDLFGPETPAWRLMREMKQTLDPAGVLNPGRLWR